ncbi:MAG: SDR family NAD(P)-dependent oxidoreductase [Bryobacteraceae bacterium]|nr:SDR family NAD(P)-dependent oxidoreductase [Bryobacteraceae bacterium]
MGTLQDKIVLITGAKGGLGTFVTQACLDAGATVVGISRSIAKSDFDHPSFSAISAELSSGKAAKQVADQVLAEHGRIDVLIHLLGAFAGGSPAASTTDDVFDSMISLNLRSAFLMIRAVLPAMRSTGAGRILAIGSKAAVEAAPGAAAYAASKAALVSLVRSVAAENSDRGISTNIVLPATMDTPATRKSMPDADFSTWVQPAQVATLLVALAGDSLSQVNGAVIPIYGRG